MRKTKFLLFVLAFMMFGVMNAEIASGTCGKDGNNITWVLDDDGTLTLSGSGEMEHYGWNYYTSSYNTPWYSNRGEIVKVSISEGITSIGEHAFYNCYSLTSVTIGNSVTSIGGFAFISCGGLTSVDIPNSVTSIGESAFYNCCGLTSVTIGNSVTSIGNFAFSGCSGLTSVTIPNSVKWIGEGAFKYCSGLTSVTIPNSVTSIGYDAFCGCSGLTSVTIPNSVKSIGNFAFCGCSGLISVTIPNSVKSIGESAFSGCNGLTSVTIPRSVTSIGNYAFYNCSGLTSVTIPNSVTTIGKNAFESCIGLTSLTIPNSVTSIGEAAFRGCYKIGTIYYNSNASYKFDSYVSEVYYGDDITIVYPISSNLSSLNKVVIGKNVEYLRQEAFKGAKLKEFYITGEKDIYLYPNVFQNVNLSNATLYVPKSRAGYYKTTEPWSDFGAIMTIDENEPEPGANQCAAPTITYSDGKLIYYTDTEGAEVISDVRVDDAKKSYSFEVPLSATYNITAYATKSGYEDSEVVTATLVWVDAQLTTDAPSDVQTVKARPIFVRSNDGNVSITGLEENEVVEVYSLSGAKLNTAKSAFGTASFCADKGNAVIVKIGDKSIKVVVK